MILFLLLVVIFENGRVNAEQRFNSINSISRRIRQVYIDMHISGLQTFSRTLRAFQSNIFGDRATLNFFSVF